MNTLLSAIDNNTIEFATEIPKNSPFISIGREIRIIRPDSLRNFLVPELLDIIEQLIIFFDSSDRDWAANVFLYAITGRDALFLSGYENDIEKWRSEQKEADLRYWKKWRAENQGHLIWDGNRLTDDISKKFDVLAKEWAEHCQNIGPNSKINNFLNHSSYRKLVELGEPAISYIIEQYRKDDLPWGFVLDEITGFHVIEDPDNFSPPEIKRRWIEWWDQQFQQKAS